MPQTVILDSAQPVRGGFHVAPLPISTSPAPRKKPIGRSVLGSGKRPTMFIPLNPTSGALKNLLKLETTDTEVKLKQGLHEMSEQHEKNEAKVQKRNHEALQGVADRFFAQKKPKGEEGENSVPFVVPKPDTRADAELSSMTAALANGPNPMEVDISKAHRKKKTAARKPAAAKKKAPVTKKKAQSKPKKGKGQTHKKKAATHFRVSR